MSSQRLQVVGCTFHVLPLWFVRYEIDPIFQAFYSRFFVIGITVLQWGCWEFAVGQFAGYFGWELSGDCLRLDVEHLGKLVMSSASGLWQVSALVRVASPMGHEALSQCWADGGSASTTLGQHQPSIGSTSRVWLEKMCSRHHVAHQLKPSKH